MSDPAGSWKDRNRSVISKINVGKSILDENGLIKACTGDGDDHTVGLTGTFDSSLVISSTGTGSDAVKIQATNATGGVEITSGTSGVSIDTLLVPSAETAVITADTTLTRAQSGTVFRVNPTLATTITLPAPVVGMKFTFVTTAVSTVDLIFQTFAGTQFMLGTVLLSDSSIAAGLSAAINSDPTATTTLTLDHSIGAFNGGTIIKFTALTSTLWFIEGLVGAETPADAIVTFT